MVFFLEPELSLGYEPMDRDHARLFSIIHRLNLSLGVKTCTSKETETLYRELFDYATEHFANEERLFAEYHYSGSDEHIAKHREIAEQLDKFKRNDCKMVDILRFLTSWLNNHILVYDKMFVEFLSR